MPRTLADLSADVVATYPYESKFRTVNGWRMHYVDEGPRDAPVVLMQHGNPTWGYLWREVVPPLLAAGYRVIVPDLIGFGLSEKPEAYGVYTLDNTIANLVSLIDQLDLREATFVLHDWGGPTGLGAALTRPERVGAVTVMSTWAWPDHPSAFHRSVLPWRMMHAPLVGPYILGTHAAMPGRGLYLSVVDRKKFAAQAQSVFEEVLADPDQRRPTYSWPRSIPIGLDSDTTTARFDWLYAGVQKLTIPAMVIWGQQDDVFQHEVFAARWHDIWPHAEGTHLVTGKHFLQEDSGAQIGALVTDFANRTNNRSSR